MVTVTTQSVTSNLFQNVELPVSPRCSSSNLVLASPSLVFFPKKLNYLLPYSPTDCAVWIFSLSTFGQARASFQRARIQIIASLLIPKERSKAFGKCWDLILALASHAIAKAPRPSGFSIVALIQENFFGH